MPTKKTEKEKPKKEEVKIEYASFDDLKKMYLVIKEMQHNLEYINDRLEKCMSRLGVEK